MSIKYHILRTLLTPPHVIGRKVLRIGQQKVASIYRRKRDLRHSTYLKASPFLSGKLYRYFHSIPIDVLHSNALQISGLTEHYLNHRFNLLGSGWVQVKHGMNCRGLEGYRYKSGSPVQVDMGGCWLEGRINQANLDEAKRIWNLVDEGYRPIDWHLDFKSGYRWREDTWYFDIPYGHKLGVDIKVPWELARMQHLPQLAWAYSLTVDGAPGFHPSRTYVREFSNEVLDFIANNPPRFGVNWHYTMEAGIRVANWLVSYDLFKAFGAEFDLEFEKVFTHSVYDHGLHIVSNLEWSEEPRSNHYLSNIAGLLFVAAYLEKKPQVPELDAWLAFAVQELLAEIPKQFSKDGSNFEASTSYHRLSAEMVIYATAIILALPEDKRAALQSYDHKLHRVQPPLVHAPIPLYPLTGTNRLTPFSDQYFERLEKMAEFTMHITKPHGHIPQIGDNDNGRFLKLQPVFQKRTVAEAKVRYTNLDGYSDLPNNTVYLDEDHLDHRHLVAAMNGLFEREDFARFSGQERLETYLVRTLVGAVRLLSYRRQGEQTAAEGIRVGTKEELSRLLKKLNSLPEDSRNMMEIPSQGGDLRKGLKLYAYPNFGLYIYRSERLYLAVRCGPIGQNKNGGHTHNDQLSLELTIDSQDLISDSGTYLFTPLPARRNEYRSVAAHFAPQFHNREPCRLDYGLFRLKDEVKAACLYFGEEAFIGMHCGYGPPVYRMVRIKADALHVIDYTKGTTPFKDIYRIEPNRMVPIPLSLGYGLRNA